MVNSTKFVVRYAVFLDTIKKGKRDGYYRYFCKNYFTYRRAHISKQTLLIRFAYFSIGTTISR